MTVRIVEPPRPKRVTCTKCRALLEYLPEDVTTRNYTACGELDSGSFIDCPHCKAWVEVRP